MDDGTCLFSGDVCDDANPSTTDTLSSQCDCLGYAPESGYFSVGDGVTDFDGNFYNTIVFDSVEWMVEDLKAVCFSNGDSTPHIPAATDWLSAGESEIGAWVWFENIPNSAKGRLYNGFVVEDE